MSNCTTSLPTALLSIERSEDRPLLHNAPEPGYVKHGDIDPRQLFVTEDVTDRLAEFADGLEERIENMLAVIDSDECPETAIGRHCNDHYSCLLQEECWKYLPEHHVMTLYSGKKLGED